MDTETRFRILLVDELTSLVNSQEINGRFVRMGHVEERQDVLGEFLDCYGDALLKYEPFTKEFTPLEIEEFRRFLRMLDDAMQLKTSWANIRAEAGKLLAYLNVSSGHVT